MSKTTISQHQLDELRDRVSFSRNYMSLIRRATKYVSPTDKGRLAERFHKLNATGETQSSGDMITLMGKIEDSTLFGEAEIAWLKRMRGFLTSTLNSICGVGLDEEPDNEALQAVFESVSGGQDDPKFDVLVGLMEIGGVLDEIFEPQVLD